MAEADRKSKLALGEALGELPLVLRDQQIVLRELLQIVFAFDFPEKGPGVLTRAGIARIEEADASLPLCIQKVVVRAQLVLADERRVVPESFARVALKGVGIFLRADVVLPDMSAPPVFPIARLRQYHIRKHVPGGAGGNHRERRRAAGDEEVEIAHAGRVLADNPVGVLRTAARRKLQRNFEFRRESRL